MSVYELWEARRSNRFTLRHWVKAWIVSARLFAVPWVVAYTIFGALLAYRSTGIFDAKSVAGAAIVTSLTLLMSHFINNYRDVERGIDRYINDPSEAGSIASKAKPYTAAALLVPLGITPLWFQKLNAVVFGILSCIAFILLVPFTPYTAAVYIAGFFVALTYTDIFKPRGFGELAIFLGHGFLTTMFGYLSNGGDLVNAAIAGIVPGAASAVIYTIDQYQDAETDFIRRVNNLAVRWWRSRLPLSLYAFISIMFYYMLLSLWVAIGFYPRGVLLSYLLVPAYLYLIPGLEYEREKSIMLLAITTLSMMPSLLCLGTIIQ